MNLFGKRIREAVDFAVIGGGSGGIACANGLGRSGWKVAVFDFVDPSPTRGTRYGFGGTCVNVGCIPKKLFHDAALMREKMEIARDWGFQVPEEALKTNWGRLRSAVQDHVKSLSFSYGSSLHENVELVRAKAELFASPDGLKREVRFHDPINDTASSIDSLKGIVVAVGGRPRVPGEIRGALENGITSDDIFSLDDIPRRPLVVGGGYVALEIAGFLGGLGFDTTLAIRSEALRGKGFDRQSVAKVLELMRERGIEVLSKTRFDEIAKSSRDGLLEARTPTTTIGGLSHVIFATGRDSTIANVCAHDSAKFELAGGKAVVSEDFETSIPNIYALGDCSRPPDLAPELTPMAIKQADRLVARIGSKEEPGKFKRAIWTNQTMENKSLSRLMVPSAVFTPVEYGRVGLGEEAARESFGEDEIEVWLQEWQDLYFSALHNREYANQCFAKIVCLKENNLVVGLHFVGPNAGEIIQGFALALNQGIQKEDLSNWLIGIHPTNGEALTQMDITRSSGSDFVKRGGCGGGRCG